MSDICTDNRFEVIERYKQKLIEATNIEQSPKEMEVIDNILFRFWQMGWLKELILCKDCKHNNDGRCSWHESLRYTWIVDGDDYCSCAERKEE